MTTPEQIEVGLPQKLRGWRTLGIRKSDGQTMCTGCWDRSDYDTEAEHNIPKGHDVWWSNSHPESGECDAYCTKCVIEDAESWEMIGTDEASAILKEQADAK